MRSNWEVVKLGRYISQQNIRNRELEDIEVYSVTNSGGFTKSTEYFNKEVFSKDLSNYKIVKRNQFAYNPSRINVGSIACLSHTDIALVSPLYVIFEVDREKLYPQYLLRYLKSNYGNIQIRNNTQGSVRDSLKYDGLERIQIPLPCIDDQIRIANVLSRVEVLIAKRKESLELLDDFLGSTFLGIFGDPVKNPMKWEKKSIKDFGQIITGNTPPRNDIDNYLPNFIEWIKTDNILENRVFLTEAAEYLSEKGLAKARSVKCGALLVACIAGSIESIGRAAITNRQVSFNQQINAIQPNEKINSLFLYWLFKISRFYIQSYATKGMKKILTKGNFEKITMIRPPVSLQNQFATIVEKVELIKAKYQVSLKELINLYSSLSQQAFKGELDLSNVVVDIEIISEPAQAKIEFNASELEMSKQFSEIELIKIIKQRASKAFNFTELLDDLKATIKELPNYERLKKMLFSMLEGEIPLLTQSFDHDKDRKEIVLKVNI